MASAEIGSGTYGCVRRESVGLVAVAVKTPSNPSDRLVMDIEVGRLASGSSRYIMPVLRVRNNADGSLSTIMPLGISDLASADKEHWSFDTICMVFRQLVDGMCAMRDRSIIHLDLKPDNVILFGDVTAPDCAVITDFGKAVYVESKDGSVNLQWGENIYSPGMKPPEEVEHSYVSFASDVYVLGLTMLDVLCNSSWEGVETIDEESNLDFGAGETPDERIARIAKWKTIRRQRLADAKASCRYEIGEGIFLELVWRMLEWDPMKRIDIYSLRKSLDDLLGPLAVPSIGFTNLRGLSESHPTKTSDPSREEIRSPLVKEIRSQLSKLHKDWSMRKYLATIDLACRVVRSGPGRVNVSSMAVVLIYLIETVTSTGYPRGKPGFGNRSASFESWVVQHISPLWKDYGRSGRTRTAHFLAELGMDKVDILKEWPGMLDRRW